MITLQIDDAEIFAALDRVARAVTDMTPVMQDIGREMVDATKERFPAGVGPDGNPWAPKSPATIANYERRREHLDLRPLWGPSGTLNSAFAYYPSESSVEWGTNVIQSAVMQFGAAKEAFGTNARGSPIPWGPIPARPFLGVSDEDRQSILAALEDWLTRAWDAQ